jgi:gamma-glutamyl:cysteine ligase YbdK (ATP-grasp superfamily)
MSILGKIFNRESANAVMVEHKLHMVSNSLSAHAYSLATVIESIDNILKDVEQTKHMEEDDIIDLGVMRERLAATVDSMIQTSKKF